MRLLLISPLGYAINENTRYSGIERLAWEYSRELSKRHDVTIVCHADTKGIPGNVKHLKYRPAPYQDIFASAELMAYELYRKSLSSFDAIHDFSHQHYASRLNADLPSLNIFWHAPAVAHYPKAPYNVIALSEWAKSEFKRFYHQDSRYVQSIVVDAKVYHPGTAPRTDRYLTLGIMSLAKGNLTALEYCQKNGLPLDIAGADSDPTYKAEVLKGCDGVKHRFLGEISHEDKVILLQICKGLLYFNSEPEVTSHKVQEALLCGAPVITSGLGALPEILAETSLEANVRKYSVENVCAEYERLYAEVAGGLRW